MKQIQISEELFTRLCSYHLLGKTDALQERIIQDGLQEKLDKIAARANYIPCKKTAP